MANFADIL